MRRISLILALLLGVGACAAGENDEDAERPADRPAERPTTMPPTHPPAPALRGVDADGERFDIEELRGDPVVLIFYRGLFCGLCKERLRALASYEEAYDRLDADVIAITPDPPELARRAEAAYDLDARIVSVDRATLEHWGLWPRGERFPRPSSFVLDEHGRIRYRHIGATAADRLSDVALLAALERLEWPASFLPAR